MPVEKLSDGRFRVRLRYGAGLRDRFIVVAKDAAAAEAKGKRLQRMATQLARHGLHAEAKVILESAGLRETERDLAEAEGVVRELCAEAAASMGAPAAIRKQTFTDVAELLFAEQLRRGNSERTVTRDRQRLNVVAKRFGNTGVDAITSKMADEAMDLVPPDAEASRFLFEGLIFRVLKHAVKLELIDRIPLRPDFVSKQSAPKKLFQYLTVDEELRLISGKAPLWRRIGYALMSREGVRPEFLSLFYWSDSAPADAEVSTIDLESGLLTHRHKQKRVRRWPVCERVLRVLRAWRALNPDTARVLPEWEHAKIARTLRADLLAAGVDRAALHRTTATERQVSAKDAGRATFVTLALRAGAPMHWVTDRTGHMSESMVSRYNRMVRESRDTVRSWLQPLDVVLGTELALPPLTDRFVVPWLQGLQGPEHGGIQGLGDLGQQLGQLMELMKKNAGLGAARETSTGNLLGASAPPEEPKTAPSSASSTTSQHAGPAGFVGMGQPVQGDPVELALAAALEAATRSERWDVVLAVTAELRERRLARVAPEVQSLEAARKRRDEGGGK